MFSLRSDFNCLVREYQHGLGSPHSLSGCSRKWAQKGRDGSEEGEYGRHKVVRNARINDAEKWAHQEYGNEEKSSLEPMQPQQEDETKVEVHPDGWEPRMEGT